MLEGVRKSAESLHDSSNNARVQHSGDLDFQSKFPDRLLQVICIDELAFLPQLGCTSDVLCSPSLVSGIFEVLSGLSVHLISMSCLKLTRHRMKSTGILA